MEETNVQGSAQQSDVSDSTETTNNIDASAQRDYKQDMFKYKQKAKELEARLESIELEKQEKKGNLQEVISKLKTDLQNEKKSNEQMRYNFAHARLDEAIKTEALSKGVKKKNLDLFMRAIDPTDKNVVEFDDSFNVKNEDVAGLVDSVMSRYDAFKKDVNIVDKTPNNQVINQPVKQVDISKLSAKEYKEYILANKDKLNF